ncbi:MAG: hypothetical protein H6821_08995 [Planctomycetaceae bacterium]|nr:hypothetical protein [Planctomycetales bacterium]MCB9874299.1 hypothetical protein [Planctomycetaceae bacterium]MCB9937947.1 hypothetical protein [Planctomycetaceae bacterium]HRX79099.1 hypothetical protein [Pirellulaceae bacterium]
MKPLERHESRLPSPVYEARRCLEQDLHFHNRSQTITIEPSEDGIILTGTVPTYYLKQMLQEVLRPLHFRVENHVHVVSATGLSDIDAR